MSDLIIKGPQPGPQTMFALCSADGALCGGSFYGGKSVSILMEAGRNIDHPKYRGVVFRRTFTQITDAGGLADIARVLYPPYGAIETKDGCLWEFPSGAKIKFNHLQHNSDVMNYRSSQFSFLGIDQVEEFDQSPVFYLISRTRPSPGYNRKAYFRFSCNPEPGWLADFIKWWWDEKTGYPIKERAGVIRYYTQIGGNIVWVPKDWRGTRGEKPISFSFVPSTMYDNVEGMKNDPSYVSKVSALDPVAVERYIKGNWLISYSGGVFNSAWFKLITIDQIPKDIKLLRYWDFAASEVKDGNDPDWSAGTLCGIAGGDIYILDIDMFRENPGITIKKVEDHALSDGPNVAIRWEEEKGSAGAFNTAHLTDKLIGFNAKGDKVKGDKVERAKPLASMAFKGKVYYVEAPWNKDFISQLGIFPKKPRDIIDSLTGNLKCLTTEKRVFPEFSISNCKSFKINWKKAYNNSIVYGSYYQEQDNTITLISSVYDPIEDSLFIIGSNKFETFNIDEIALNSVKLLNLKSSQNIRLIGNEKFITDDPVKKSTSSILREFMNIRQVNFSPFVPIAYDEAGSISYFNVLLCNGNVFVHKSQIELAAQIASWAYVEGKLEENFPFCRNLLYIISDIKQIQRDRLVAAKQQDYKPMYKPKAEVTASWQAV